MRTPIKDFLHSEIMPSESSMNAELIREMAESEMPFSETELSSMLSDHKAFIESGGANGYFEKMQVSGLPMNIYLGAASQGKQLMVSQKRISPNTNFQNVQLSFADFSGCICENVNFKGAYLDGSLLTDAFFANADFAGASLIGADFSRCDLRGVSFKNANLKNADFENANCESADFTGANISNATFKGTNLNQVLR